MASSEDAIITQAETEGLRRKRAAILTARLGIIQAVLLLVSVWLLTYIPAATASDAELAAFYESDDRRLAVLVGLYLIPFSAIAFLWFAVALRMWAERSTAKVDALLSNVQLFSAIIFISLLLAGAAASTVPAITMELGTAPFDPSTAREFPQFGGALLVVLAMRLAAMFVFTTSSITRRHGLPPPMVCLDWVRSWALSPSQCEFEPTIGPRVPGVGLGLECVAASSSQTNARIAAPKSIVQISGSVGMIPRLSPHHLTNQPTPPKMARITTP